MLALPDLQRTLRDALVHGGTPDLGWLLVGGDDSNKRLAIHQRHYRASLIRALLERFPATTWLVGSSFVTEAASEFVRTRAPLGPCLSEYGDEFPTFVATRSSATEILYLKQFVELEWHLGRLALAVDVPSLTAGDLPTSDAAALADATVTLQPGVHYFHADWAIDELISLYLSGDSPERFALQPGDVWLELRGVRGELTMKRLRHAEFLFRAALAAGKSISDAALSALEIKTTFEPGLALLHLVRDRLVVGIQGSDA